MKIFLLFYMCHFAVGLTHCYKTTVFFTFIYELKDELRLTTARGSYHQGSEGMFKREHDLLSVSLDFCEIVRL